MEKIDCSFCNAQIYFGHTSRVEILSLLTSNQRFIMVDFENEQYEAEDFSNSFGEVKIASGEDCDKHCAYRDICCWSCCHIIGRIYITTNGSIDQFIDVPLLNEKSILTQLNLNNFKSVEFNVQRSTLNQSLDGLLTEVDNDIVLTQKNQEQQYKLIKCGFNDMTQVVLEMSDRINEAINTQETLTNGINKLQFEINEKKKNAKIC